jgi:acetolactate synthase-1/2/3 large subunit
VKLAEAHGLSGGVVRNKAEIEAAIKESQQTKSTRVLDFRVAAEDAVYPMVPSGKALHKMIRRPRKSPVIRQDT